MFQQVKINREYLGFSHLFFFFCALFSLSSILDSLQNHRSGFFVTVCSSWRNGCSVYSAKRRGDFIINIPPSHLDKRKIASTKIDVTVLT